MYKFNGEHWYKAPVWYKRIRKWFIWIGGWEKANCEGWRIFRKDYVPHRDKDGKIIKEQIDKFNSLTSLAEKEEFKKKHWKVKYHLNDPTPFSLFGHWFVCYGWGMRFSLKSGYLTITWSKAEGKKCYISPNGTPSKAHTWYWGAPREIKESVKKIELFK